ncbi:MAG TPA: oligosaccharide flippase family protein [Cellvibrio sp.]
MLSKLLEKLKTRSEFFRSVSVLVTGTAFAQMLMLLALPLLTRLYSPAEFSILAIYISFLGVISIAACLGFDMAVSMPEKDEDAVNILALGIFFACLVSLIVVLVLYLLSEQFFIDNGLGSLLPFLWMLPVGVLLSATYSAIQFYAVREKAFSDISKTRMAQSVVTISTQVGFGSVGITPFGLLFGQMLNGGSGAFYLWNRVISKKILLLVSLRNMKKMFIEYRRFPQFTAFEMLTNTAGIQIPIIMIASLAAGPEAGFLMLAMRVMQAPMGLIGGAIGQVFLSNAPQEHRNNNLAPFTGNIINGLLKAGVGPIIFAGIVAPPAFSIVFGSEWERAGTLVAWMTPWFVFQFLASPISMAMHVKNLQKLMLLITFSGFLLRVGVLLYASKFSIENLSEYYAISGGIFYFICFLIFSTCAGLTIPKLISFFWKSGKYIVGWVVLGILVKFIALFFL